MNQLLYYLLGTAALAAVTYVMYAGGNVQFGIVGVALTVLAFWMTVDKAYRTLVGR